MNKLLIKDIPKEERPRERFIKYGVSSLSNEELIAIILKTGTKNISVKEISLNILKKYKDISNRVNNLYDNYSSKEPHKTNAMNKMMTWYGIQMKTMVDDTTSKLSELLMQGTNMGIIEGRRLLNQNQNIEPDVKNILNDFVVMQEDSVETLKKYL